MAINRRLNHKWLTLFVPAAMMVILLSWHSVWSANLNQYEAIVRLSNSQLQNVTIEASDVFNARLLIQQLYCGGKSCIFNGPWLVRNGK
jgi:hypothetical protein